MNVFLQLLWSVSLSDEVVLILRKLLRVLKESEEFKSSKCQTIKSHIVIFSQILLTTLLFLSALFSALGADWTFVLKEASRVNTEITQGLGGIISYAAL